MKTVDSLLPIARTSDDQFVFYRQDARGYDGVVKVGDTEVPVTLADFFAKRTDITPIEDSPETRSVWAELRKEMGVTELQPESIKALPRPDRFDPDAVDADNDGKVQDGTPFERPSAPNKPSAISDISTVNISTVTPRLSRTTSETREAKNARQRAVNQANARKSGLSKVANKMFGGRRRDAKQRRDILGKSAWGSFPGVQRLFKSRDDAYADLKESTIRTLGELKQLAESGQLSGKAVGTYHMGRPLDPALIEHIKKRTPEQLWAELEDTVLKLHEKIGEMPIESKVPGNIAERIIDGGMLGDPTNRVGRKDHKTPWVFEKMKGEGLTLTDEDIAMLHESGLTELTSRGQLYDSLREVLEMAMGFNGPADRKGRPVYGYFASPSAPRVDVSKQGVDPASLTELGTRLHDTSNAPNLPGYSSTGLVRLRPTTRDRAGYTVGDGLRNGILPQRVSGGDDKDTVLAAIHDRDITHFTDPTLAEEMRQVQHEYLLNMLEYSQSGNIDDLLKHDYIEALVPFDVTPEEIEEMVIASDHLGFTHETMQDAVAYVKEYVKGLGLSQSESDRVMDFLELQLTNSRSRLLGGNAETDVSAAIAPALGMVIQLFRANQIRTAGEAKGINMTVGPSLKSSPATIEQALETMMKRFR